MTKARYVVFDGVDGSGKGTQLELLQGWFGDRALFTREPGGTPFAEKIRKLVRNDPLAAEATPLTNFLLFWAAREELVEKVIMPALEAGQSVFSDRGYSSTWAYQIHGEQRKSLEALFVAMRIEMFQKNGRCPPDLHIVYDLPAEVARERVMRDTVRERNHFDDRPLAYYRRVREGFRSLGLIHEEVRFIYATQTPQQMHLETLEVLKQYGIE